MTGKAKKEFILTEGVGSLLKRSVLQHNQESILMKKAKVKKNKKLMENLCLLVMLGGIVMLCQPLNMSVFTWGFPVILLGFMVHTILAHLP